MKLLYSLSIVLLLTACGEKSKNNKASNNATIELEEEAAEPIPQEKSTQNTNNDEEIAFQLSDCLGYYVGEFEAAKWNGDYMYSSYNKINISIDSFSDSKIYGHSVVAGNDRPFTGKYEQPNNQLSATGMEPGDDKYDGIFTFSITANGELTGTWVANNKKIKVWKRKYNLTKSSFAYNANNNLSENLQYNHLFDETKEFDYENDGEFLTPDVSKFNSSTDTLKPKDLENMYKGDLEILRNSIYARHGYSFKNRKIRYIFDKHIDWYIPVSTDVRDEITDLEWANIELIKRYEDHAEKYYDSFGR